MMEVTGHFHFGFSCSPDDYFVREPDFAVAPSESKTCKLSRKCRSLIPARNEETVLGRLLDSLEKLDYPDFEVIVCNDHSSDNTEEILNSMADEDERFHWFLGEKLHAGLAG